MQPPGELNRFAFTLPGRRSRYGFCFSRRCTETLVALFRFPVLPVFVTAESPELRGRSCGNVGVPRFLREFHIPTAFRNRSQPRKPRLSRTLPWSNTFVSIVWRRS